MGRRAIDRTQLINDPQSRRVMYCKRKKVILLQAIELATLCDQKILLVIRDEQRDRLVEFQSHPDFGFDEAKISLAKTESEGGRTEKYSPDDYDALRNGAWIKRVLRKVAAGRSPPPLDDRRNKMNYSEINKTPRPGALGENTAKEGRSPLACDDSQSSSSLESRFSLSDPPGKKRQKKLMVKLLPDEIGNEALLGHQKRDKTNYDLSLQGNTAFVHELMSSNKNQEPKLPSIAEALQSLKNNSAIIPQPEQNTTSRPSSKPYQEVAVVDLQSLLGKSLTIPGVQKYEGEGIRVQNPDP